MGGSPVSTCIAFLNKKKRESRKKKERVGSKSVSRRGRSRFVESTADCFLSKSLLDY